MALLAPEACPASTWRTDDSTTLAIGAKNRAMPAPARKNGATISEYAIEGERIEAIQASAMACSASPVAISGRPPMRSDRAPAAGAMKIGIAVQGRMRRPALSGE